MRIEPLTRGEVGIAASVHELAVGNAGEKSGTVVVVDGWNALLAAFTRSKRAIY